MPLFNVLENLNSDTVDDNETPDHNHDETNDQTNTSTSEHVENIDHENPDDHQKVTIIPMKSTDRPRRSTRIPQPSKAILQSKGWTSKNGPLDDVLRPLLLLMEHPLNKAITSHAYQKPRPRITFPAHTITQWLPILIGG